ncbi:MAG: hypothetical protein OXT09_14430 [Myxococcales bacterium]|nr:hypothetical protein [Myxococcales bacterium]
MPLDFEVGMVVPERKTLAQQRWELSELPAKRTLRFTIDKDLPACQWRRDAEALPDTQETRRAIEAFARAYHAAHTRRDAAAITEMDLYAWNERPRCLGRTLSNVRKRALERDLDDHTVDPLPSELTLERLDGGRLYQVTRAGAPLITGKFGTSGGLFRWRLFVAKIDGRLTVPF